MNPTFIKLIFIQSILMFTQNVSAKNSVGNTEPSFPKTKTQITFKENLGQVSDQFYKPRPDVLFSGTDGQLVFHLKNNGISYQLSRVDSWKKPDPENSISPRLHKTKEKEPEQITIYRLDVNWINANTKATVSKTDALPDVDNYYLEVCPNGVTGVKSYKQITYQNLYKGINLKWYEKNGNLKYDYVVAAGADYKEIQLELNGAEKISLNSKGELIIKTPLGELIEQKPFVEQNGKQLDAKWIIKNNIVSFDIKNINPTLSFNIDPLIRLWGTYYGGNNDDQGWYLATDALANVFLGGYTKTPTTMAIATSGGFQTIFGGIGTGTWQGDAFLVMFNSVGVRQWGTYYGGAGSDFSNNIVTDAMGNVYMCGGTTSTVAIATSGSHQSFFGGGPLYGDSFLAKFNSSGALVWATYYGGNDEEWAIGCSVDNVGDVYLVGGTNSTNNISSVGSHQPTKNNVYDAFIVKFNSGGTRLWGTYYGGNGEDNGIFCANDLAGNVYVGGSSASNNLGSISTSGSHQVNYGGGSTFYGDGFLTKFNSAGVRQWGTYYGGNLDDEIFGVACDAFGNVYCTGSTETFTGTSIASPGSHQPIFGGGTDDGFLVSFNSSGTRNWGTYYGGTGVEDWQNVAVSPSGDIYLSGQTNSKTGTVIATPCTYQFNYGGGAFDAYLAKFTAGGTRLWGTYYGGNGSEYWPDCITDLNGNVFIGGTETVGSGTVMSSSGCHQNTYGGGPYDAFIAKFDGCIPASPPNTTAAANLTVCPNNSTALSTTVSCGINWCNAAIGGSTLGVGSNFTTPTLPLTTTYYIEELSCGVSAPRTPVTVTVIPIPNITITGDILLCLGQNTTLSANGASTYTWLPSPNLNTTNGGTVVATPNSNSTYSVIGANGSLSKN